MTKGVYLGSLIEMKQWGGSERNAREVENIKQIIC